MTAVESRRWLMAQSWDAVAEQVLRNCIMKSASAPFMLRISALQFLFELRINFTPEDRQVLGNLHRAVIWREHLDADGDAAIGDSERFFDGV
jgi:hypothetical protein